METIKKNKIYDVIILDKKELTDPIRVSMST